MRSRMVREGSVGLFIIFGVAVFAGLSVWLKGLELAQNAYSFQVKFTNANGMKRGAPVRYRGFEVGKIIAVEPAANQVDVTVEITAPDLRIPQDALIEANQAGFIGETSIDISPKTALSSNAQNFDPKNESCDSTVIICANDRLTGEIGVSFDTLMRSTAKLTDLYTDPTFFKNLNSTAQNAGLAAGEIANLSRELTLLSQSVRAEVKNFSSAATSVTEAAEKTSNQLTETALKIENNIDKFGDTATQLSNTAAQFGKTADEVSNLANNVNGLVAENRSQIQTTLTNLSDTSEKLQTLLVTSEETMSKVNGTLDQVNLEKTVANLEVLTANAAEASVNLKDISQSLNDPNNVVLLQQTLDAARVTFENAQKITSDLDELTGDPTFRHNLINLVNGLSNLVSSTENLETQIETAQVLELFIAQQKNIKKPEK